MQIQPITKSSLNIQRRPQKNSSRYQTLPQIETVTNQNYFKTLTHFNNLCRHDNRLTPATQLIYRVILDFGNAAFWQYPVLCSDEELIRITRLAKQTITDSKRRLKSLGFVQFTGKPTKYIIYSLPGGNLGQQLGNSDTALVNCTNNQTNIKKEEINKKKEGVILDNEISQLFK